MKKIGFDLDDVLLNFSDPFRDFLNKKYNMTVKREDLRSFYIEKFFGLNDEVMRDEVANFLLHEDHKNALPMEGSMQVIERLSRKYILEIITAKPDTLSKDTEEWLQKFFKGMFKVVHFTNHYHEQHKKKKKSDVCVSENVNLFIDDSLDNAIDVANVGIPVLLYDTPWNQTEILPDLVKRVFSWEEIEKEIDILI